MPKSRGRKPPKPPQAPKPPPPPPKKPWRWLWQIAIGVGGTFVAVVGFASAVASFLPRMTVEAATGADVSQPSATTFTITNTGPIPLAEVQPILGICQILFNLPPNKTQDDCNGPLGTKLAPTKWFVKSLGVDEKHIIRMDELFNVRGYSSASISIVIQYSLPYFPFRIFRREKEFRFATRMEREGTLTWVPRPVEK